MSDQELPAVAAQRAPRLPSLSQGRVVRPCLHAEHRSLVGSMSHKKQIAVRAASSQLPSFLPLSLAASVCDWPVSVPRFLNFTCLLALYEPGSADLPIFLPDNPITAHRHLYNYTSPLGNNVLQVLPC
jgi:hypothetical protein